MLGYLRRSELILTFIYVHCLFLRGLLYDLLHLSSHVHECYGADGCVVLVPVSENLLLEDIAHFLLFIWEPSVEDPLCYGQINF